LEPHAPVAPPPSSVSQPESGIMRSRWWQRPAAGWVAAAACLLLFLGEGVWHGELRKQRAEERLTHELDSLRARLDAEYKKLLANADRHSREERLAALNSLGNELSAANQKVEELTQFRKKAEADAQKAADELKDKVALLQQTETSLRVALQKF